MTSGTLAGSRAHPLSTASPGEKSLDNRPPRSPSPPHKKASASPRSPSSQPAKDRPTAKRLPVDDHARTNGVNGHNDSEAETEILSDTEQDKTKGKKKTTMMTVKAEDGADAGRTRHPNSPRYSRKHSDHADRSNGSEHRGAAEKNSQRRTTNGDRHDERAKSKSASPSNRSHSRAPTDSTDARQKSPSADTAPSPTVASSDRGRTASLSGSRKRKIREEHHLRNLEPPRQRIKSDPSTKSPATHNLRGAQPTSPSATSPGLRSHKRSQSTQSVVTSAHSRKRKELPSAQDRKQWRSDTSSDASSSPQPTTPAIAHHPTTRNKQRPSHRSTTSPARATAAMGGHKKNVDKFGATRLAREAEKGNMDQVRLAFDAAPEELNQEDFAGFAPLQKAALNGHADVVEFLIKKGCRTDCHSKEHDTPLIDAVENGHVDVVKLLLDAGVNPHFQNKKGERALDVLNNDEDDVEEIEQALLKAMREHASDDDVTDSPVVSRDTAEKTERNDLLYLESSLSNLRKYAAKGDAVAVDHFLNSVAPDNACAIGAARGGHEIVLNLLLASASPRLDKDMDPSKYDETPLTVAIGRGHVGVLRMLLDQDNFNPTRRNKDDKTYWELAEERRGPKWQQEVELLRERYDEYRAKRQAAKKRSLGAHPAEKAAKVAKLRSPKSPEAKRTARTSSPVPSSDTKALSTSGKPKIKQEKTADDGLMKIRRPSDDLQVKRGKGDVAKGLGSPRDAKARRRRIVDEDDSSDSDHGGDGSTRKTGRPPGRPRKSLEMTTKARREPSSPSAAKDKFKEKEKDNDKRRASLPKSKDAEKGKETAKEDEEMPDAPAEPPTPKEPVKQHTPEPVRLRRIVEAEQEAERQRLASERARLVEEQRIAEVKRKEWVERIAKLPNALRIACERGKNRPLHFSGDEMGISMSFLPIHTVPLAQLDADCADEQRGEEWMMSFQAVGVLGLRDLDVRALPATSGWPTRPVTDEQRARFLRTYDVSQLASQDSCEEGSAGFDALAAGRAVADARQRFAAMQPLLWVRYVDFMREVAEREWLADLAITTAPCCVEAPGGGPGSGAETPRSLEEMIMGLNGIVRQQRDALLTPPSAVAAELDAATNKADKANVDDGMDLDGGNGDDDGNGNGNGNGTGGENGPPAPPAAAAAAAAAAAEGEPQDEKGGGGGSDEQQADKMDVDVAANSSNAVGDLKDAAVPAASAAPAGMV